MRLSSDAWNCFEPSLVTRFVALTACLLIRGAIACLKVYRFFRQVAPEIQELILIGRIFGLFRDKYRNVFLNGIASTAFEANEVFCLYTERTVTNRADKHRKNGGDGRRLMHISESITMIKDVVRPQRKDSKSMTKILDGTAIAAAIQSEVAEQVKQLAAKGIRPGLAAVLVGNVPASQIYVRSKVRTCEQLGIYSDLITPPETVTTEEMLDLVAKLNARDDIDGILLQLPMPKQVDAKRLLDAVDPAKDVDGFHPVTIGHMLAGQPGLQPCTPAGVIQILKRSGIPIAGQNAVVLGRSDIVGKPVAVLLLHENATVTICHSKTRDLPSITRQADILVAAIGRPGFVTPDMVKPGATVIDVGINRLTTKEEVDLYFGDNKGRHETFALKGSTIVGDVHPKAFEVSGAYTPVPGGVGKLTIAMLMANTVKAAQLRRGV
jgi:methylenetetrahydrofolate dehydrogenase (NADP+)/methenyltetrahydrofolate cyclohydrolase